MVGFTCFSTSPALGLILLQLSIGLIGWFPCFMDQRKGFVRSVIVWGIGKELGPPPPSAFSPLLISAPEVSNGRTKTSDFREHLTSRRLKSEVS